MAETGKEDVARKLAEEKRRKEAEDRILEERRSSIASSLPESESEQTRRKRTRARESPEKKRAKARKEETDSDPEDAEEEETNDPMDNLAKVLSKMRQWWKQPTIMKMVTKPQTEKFERYMNKYADELIRAREERLTNSIRTGEEKIRMESQIEERSALIEIVRSTVREEIEKGKLEPMERKVISYADAAGRRVPKVSGVKGPVLPPPKVVIIRQENKESEEVKKTLKELVKPSQIGLKVKRLSKIRNGVMVETETEEGVEKLLKNEELQKAGLKVEKPTRRKPVIMVYDVKAELKDDDIRQEVYGRNLERSEITEEEFKEEFQVRHRYKEARGGRDADKRSHLVVECSVRVRNWLRAKERVFIEWESCRIKDFVDVARCYKCQRYGHVAKHCTSAKPSCSKCAEDHDFKECKNKDKTCCANCKREGRVEARHPATWRECPAYERAAKRYNEQIDYGGV